MSDYCYKHNVPKLEYGKVSFSGIGGNIIDHGTQMLCPVCSAIRNAKRNAKDHHERAKMEIRSIRREIQRIKERDNEEVAMYIQSIRYAESHPQEVYDSEVKSRAEWKAKHEAELQEQELKKW